MDEKLRPNILQNLTRYVDEELQKENIPADAKYVIVSGIDISGFEFMAAVNIHKAEKFNVKVASLWEHKWDGDDTIAAKVIFVGK